MMKGVLFYHNGSMCMCVHICMQSYMKYEAL